MAVAWVEVAVAATEPQRGIAGGLLGGLVLAACALPGVMPATAQAEEAPEQGVVAFKLSGYGESQSKSDKTPGAGVSGASGGSLALYPPGDKRIGVTSPSLYTLVPIGRHWSAEGSLTVDKVSGASPRYYTDISGASHMTDQRTAADLKVTRYFERQSIGLGLARSKESDYLSQAYSIEGRLASADQNTTLNLGYGLTLDKINPHNLIVTNARKRTAEYQIGVTQAISAGDLAQISYTRSLSSGYLNDPYKLYDDRPDQRNAHIVQTRWNHWLGESALKVGYRFYRDTYGVQAHTADVAWVRPLTGTLTVTPSLRYHTQRAASFYGDPSSDVNIYPGPVGNPENFANDQRLSAFGALTVGGKVEWRFAPLWTADAKVEFYRQSSSWRLFGNGSPGLQPLSAVIWQIGLARSF